MVAGDIERLRRGMTLPDAGSSLEAWTLALARPTIAPAGGSSAAIAASMAASLVEMVAGLTLALPNTTDQERQRREAAKTSGTCRGGAGTA